QIKVESQKETPWPHQWCPLILYPDELGIQRPIRAGSPTQDILIREYGGIVIVHDKSRIGGKVGIELRRKRHIPFANPVAVSLPRTLMNKERETRKVGGIRAKIDKFLGEEPVILYLSRQNTKRQNRPRWQTKVPLLTHHKIRQVPV